MQTNRDLKYISWVTYARNSNSIQWVPYNLSFCKRKHTHVSVDWRQSTYTSFMHAYQRRKFFFHSQPFLLLLFLLPLLLFTAHCWLLVCMGSRFLHTVLFVKIRTPCYNFSDVKLPAGDVSLIKMTCKEPISARVAA